MNLTPRRRARAPGEMLASRVRGGASAFAQLLFGQTMIEQRAAAYATLLLRLTLGWLFIAHLCWKFATLPGGVERWWADFAANGYHWLVPWYVISAEFAVAVLLIPAIYTRWVSLYAIPLMIGAAQFWFVRTFISPLPAASCRSFGPSCCLFRHCSATARTR
jgi:putative oxidoreductase